MMGWANFNPINVAVNTLASGRRQGYYSEFGKKDGFHKTLLQQRGEPLFTIKGLWDLEICRHVVGPGACLAAKPGAFSQQERGYELKTRPAIRVSGHVGACEATRPRTRVALNLTARARSERHPGTRCRTRRLWLTFCQTLLALSASIKLNCRISARTRTSPGDQVPDSTFVLFQLQSS